MANFVDTIKQNGTNVSLSGHTHAATDLASGTVSPARLGSGTADATTFLRGDNTWVTPAGGGTVTGTGTSGKLAQWTGTSAVGNSNLTGPASNALTLEASSSGLTLTIPATGTAALRDVANTFSAAQTFSAQVNLNTDTKIQSSAPHDWWVTTGQNVFNSHTDDVFGIGYNIAGGLSVGGRRDTTDYQVGFLMERDYWYDATHHQAEYYFQYISSDGATTRRPLTITVNHATYAQVATFSGNVQFLTDAGGQAFIFSPGTGALYIDGSSPQITFLSNNPAIQTSTNTPVLFLTNNKFSWISNTVEGFEFGDVKDAALYRAAAKVLVASANSLEGWRVDGTGSQANIGVLGGSSYGGGVGVLAVKDATTAPSSNPSGGGVLYSESGTIKWRSSSGSITPADDNSLISRTYAISRTQNLIANGSGLLNNNYNFSSFTFDAVETHGGGGSFKNTRGGSTSNQTLTSDEYLPIDPGRFYRLVIWAKSGDTGGGNYNASNTQYVGIVAYDIDQLMVLPQHFMKLSGSTDTTLAAALNPGDTTMSLTNATGWHNGSTAYQRNFSWWPYTNSKGYSYPNYTYTRNNTWDYSDYASNGVWAASGISGNTVTLRGTWAGPALPSGTPVRNLDSGGTYKYIAINGTAVPNSWTRYEGSIGGYDTNGTNATNLFSYGTAFVKLLFLPNYSPTTNNIVRFSDIWFSELSLRNLLSVKSGAPADSDYGDAPPDTTQVVDSTNNRLYVRVNDVWKYAPLNTVDYAALSATNTFTVGQIVQTGAAATKGLIVRGASSQSATLQEWQSVTPTTLASIRSDGLADLSSLGVATKTKAGAPVDGDWASAPPTGTLVVDTTNNRLYARTGAATWIQAPAVTENTYTPTYVGGTSAGTTTYTSQTGVYRQVGNMVFFSAKVVWTAANGTGNARISLPSTAANVSNQEFAVQVYHTAVTFANGSVVGRIQPNTAYVEFLSPATNAAGTAIAVEAAGTMVVSGFYVV